MTSVGGASSRKKLGAQRSQIIYFEHEGGIPTNILRLIESEQRDSKMPALPLSLAELRRYATRRIPRLELSSLAGRPDSELGALR